MLCCVGNWEQCQNMKLYLPVAIRGSDSLIVMPSGMTTMVAVDSATLKK